MNAMNRNQNLMYSLEGSIDLQSIMRQVYTWMVLGMLLTTFVAYVTASTALVNLATNPVIMLIAIIAEFGVVLGISFGFKRLSAGTATLLFFIYAALNGFTLSIILLAFSVGTVFLAFASTAALFGVMTIIGYTTRVDLSRMGTFLIMGVVGLMIAMVINLFVNSGPLDMIVSIAGVLIGRMAEQMSLGGESGVKFGIFGALKLYLDFINMFLFILRLFGRRR
jgi:FtsH-binding integral membrane protein